MSPDGKIHPAADVTPTTLTPMEPAVIGTRLASSVIGPLIKKLFVPAGPGAGLVERPVRLSALVAFRGEKRTLTEPDVRRLAQRLVDRSLASPGEAPFPPDEATAVTDALTRVLLALGDLDMDDVQAVRLGHRELARALTHSASATGAPLTAELSADAASYLASVTEWACLHVLHFFTQRSTFVAATLVAQSRGQDELIAKVDELIARHSRPEALDTTFERRYLAYVAKKHGKLTIFGIDLTDTPGKWPLDAAYMSLEATAPGRVTMARFLSGAEYHAEEVELVEHTAPLPADQALAAHDRVLLRGEAGSGKTTLVQWLAVSAARQELTEGPLTYLYDRVPYVLPLRDLTRHGERLPAPAGFLTAVGCPLAGTQPSGWEARVLTAGRALVLVDGIDEIPDAERARTRAWLTDLIDAYPGNHWLVTSRPSAVRADWLAEEGFTELTLSPMNDKEVAAFIERWHAAAATGNAEEDAALTVYERQLLAAVKSKPDLGRLATNPLMCGLICALHRDRRGFLPLGRKDLYTAALSMLLLRRDRERHMAVPDLREEPQLQLLQRLAYWLIRNGRTVMDRSRAESIIADALPAVPELAALGDAKAVYTHFLHRSGLLREPGPGTVDFVHRTFQDFLGARAAVEEGDFGVLARHATDDQWEDVIRMAVAQARPRERAELLRELLSYGDKHPDARARKRIHLLAAACLEHAVELAPGVRGEVERRTAQLIPPQSRREARELGAVGPMVLDLLPGPDGLDDEDARDVAITLTHIRSDTAIPHLARFTRHPALAVRRQLMWGWGRFERRAYAEQVIARLDDGMTHFSIRDDEQVAELERLGLRPKHLDIRETVSPEAASRLLAATPPTYLSLGLSPARLTDEALMAVRGMTELRLCNIREPYTLAPLPPEAPLRTLGVLDPDRHLGDLRHVDRWPCLAGLMIAHESAALNGLPWDTFTRLPRLTMMMLPSGCLAEAAPGVRLPGVTELTLNVESGWEAAQARLGELFPGVRRLHLAVLPDREPIDVAPLPALLPDLALVSVPVAFGYETFPVHIKVDAYALLADD